MYDYTHGLDVSEYGYGLFARVYTSSGIYYFDSPALKFSVIAYDKVTVSAKKTELIAGLDTFADAEASVEITLPDGSTRSYQPNIADINFNEGQNGFYFIVVNGEVLVCRSVSRSYFYLGAYYGENGYGNVPAGTYQLKVCDGTDEAIESANNVEITLKKVDLSALTSLSVNQATAPSTSDTRQLFSFTPETTGKYTLKPTSGQGTWYQQTEDGLEKVSGNLTQGTTYIAVWQGAADGASITVQRTEVEMAIEAAEQKVNDAEASDAESLKAAVDALKEIDNQELVDSDSVSMVTKLEKKLLEATSDESAAHVRSTVVHDKNDDDGVESVEGAAVTVAAALNDDMISAPSGAYAAQIAVDTAEISTDDQGKMTYSVEIVMNIVDSDNAVVKEKVALQAPICITMDLPYALWEADFDLYHGDTKLAYTKDVYDGTTITFVTPSLSPFTLVATGCNAHDWGDWKMLTPATCTENGTREATCTVCGAKKSAVAPKTGHKGVCQVKCVSSLFDF